MPLVTVTYNAWDHNREVIPASRQPRVGFRPLRTSLAQGLMTNREVWGTLNANGTGQARLESAPGVLYVPFMDWLTGPATSENDRGGYCEWQPILPGNGGDITDLADLRSFGPIIAVLGRPPAGTSGIVWIDLTDVTPAGVQVYGPREAF